MHACVLCVGVCILVASNELQWNVTLLTETPVRCTTTGVQERPCLFYTKGTVCYEFMVLKHMAIEHTTGSGHREKRSGEPSRVSWASAHFSESVT